MKKKFKILALVLAAALVVSVPAVFMVSGSKYAAQIVSPDAESAEKNSDLFLSEIGFDKQKFISDWGSSSEKIQYISENENYIYFEYICCEKYEYNAPTVILLPDHGSEHTAMYPSADVLLRNGFNVILLDQRSHGRNTGETFTFGELEKADIDGVINYMKNNYPVIPTTGLLGQGTGAVTAAYYISCGETSEYIRFAVLEDPYSSASDFIEMKISQQNSIIPASLQRSLTLSAMTSKYDFDPSSVNIASMISATTRPVLVMTQEGCNECPSSLGEKVFNAVTIDDKKLVKFDETHYLHYLTSEKEKYTSELIGFVNEHQ